MVKAGTDKSPGKLVLTDRSIFALKSVTEATTTGGILGGPLGALIGQTHSSQYRLTTVSFPALLQA